jgi:hypothetical protein
MNGNYEIRISLSDKDKKDLVNYLIKNDLQFMMYDYKDEKVEENLL